MQSTLQYQAPASWSPGKRFNRELGLLEEACDSVMQEAEAGGLDIPVYPGQNQETKALHPSRESGAAWLTPVGSGAHTALGFCRLYTKAYDM